MALELIIVTPDSQTRRVPLQGACLSLGRAHSNDLCYADDASLSRKHLQFERDESGWWADDQKSKNGTLLNGSRITTKQLIQAGDRFNVGHLLIKVSDPELSSEGEVVFVPGEAAEPMPGATVMTSLQGLLSGEATAPVVAAPGVRERRQAFESPEVRALVRAGRELAGARPLEELFPLILNLSIEAVGAERGLLMTLERGQLVTRAVHGEGFRISTTVRDRVLKQKTSLLVRDLDQEEAFKNQISIGVDIHTMIAVPLQTEDDVIGLIYVDSRSFVREFTPDDLNLLTVLANVAAIRIERERLAEIESETHQAAEIQRGILPSAAPEVDGIDIAGYNVASRTVGGDYYDFIPSADGRMAVALADVAGKGMAAAMLMSNLQAMVRILAEEIKISDLARLVSRLDQAVSLACPRNRFITMFFSVVDPANDRLSYCNAGHNPALLCRADGSIDRLVADGTVLGILPDLGYEEHEAEFRAGEVLAIYSDGVTEAEGPGDEEFGEKRLAEVLQAHSHQSAARVVRRVIEAVEEWTEGAPLTDDLTLVVVRRT
ncbi:MAG: SpoIIE family protein phosphatase [bacterium]|nr:SpoIIE family protein phosphatase [bacterium]